MVRTAGAVIIAITLIWAGFAASQRLIGRASFLEQLLLFVTSLKTQIRFNSGDLLTLLSCGEDSRLLCPFLQECRQNMHSCDFYEAWKASVDKIPKSTGLKDSDKELLIKFGLGLGATDVQGQLSHCELYINLINERLENARLEKTKLVKLYRILGLSSAAGVFLVII